MGLQFVKRSCSIDNLWLCSPRAPVETTPCCSSERGGWNLEAWVVKGLIFRLSLQARQTYFGSRDGETSNVRRFWSRDAGDCLQLPPSSCKTFFSIKAFEITAIQFRKYWAISCLVIGWLSWPKLLTEKIAWGFDFCSPCMGNVFCAGLCVGGCGQAW